MQFFVCSHCRSRIQRVEDALFVDASTNRPFCSKACIVEFHRPYTELFASEEERVRKENSVLDECNQAFFEQMMDDEVIFRRNVDSPDSVWRYENAIGEVYYTHICECRSSQQAGWFYISICSYFDNTPSFVFFKTVTRSERVLSYYRRGSEIGAKAQTHLPSQELSDIDKDVEPEMRVDIPSEVMESVELKKSEYLAQLLEVHSDKDIAFEQFGAYDDYLPLTLDDADEVYEQEDDAGDKIKTFIKSFVANKMTFFYVVICLDMELSEQGHNSALLPILSFPSADKELYKLYARGRRISSMIKN